MIEKFVLHQVEVMTKVFDMLYSRIFRILEFY